MKTDLAFFLRLAMYLMLFVVFIVPPQYIILVIGMQTALIVSLTLVRKRKPKGHVYDRPVHPR